MEKYESRIAEYVRKQLIEDEKVEQLYASARNIGICPHGDNHQLS